MKKRHIWLLLPTALLPYLALSALAVIFYSTKIPLCRMIMERLFQGNGLLLIATVLVFALLSVLCGILFFVISIRRKWEPYSLAKTAMILKLVHIPAYLLNFVLGVLLLISVFTFPAALALVFLDGMMLFLSGLVFASALINASRRGMITKKACAIFGIAQFIYIADVIFAVVFYVKLTKKKQAHMD